MAAAKLGLVGLGNLGMEFGLRAVAASRSVVAHDASPRLALAGAARADSVGAVVAAAPTVVSVVPDDAAARAVADELAAAAGRGSDAPPLLHVSCSTISPAASRRRRRDAAAGVGYVAAPVFARPENMRAGQASFAVSGGDAALRARAVTDALAALARRERGYGGRVAGRDHAPGGFALHHGLKDVGLVQKAAQDARVPMPLGSLLVDQFTAASNDAALAGLDWSALGLHLSKNAGVDASSK
ncbi:3-hydroxyisobutyrate dehydrogenase [Aureococcus anophagefferens]|nr:3-hydroxyisobutyrate dehydrogenase [Aureococcus anophagefferens]